MPSVLFQPGNVLAEVPDGTLIHQAAIRAGILDLELPCGGEGVCGLCKVQLEGRDTAVLACRTKVTSDIVVHLPERQRGARVLGDSQSLVDPALLPERAHLSPLYRQLRITIPPASLEEHYSDWTRLSRELNRGNETHSVCCELSVLRGLAEELREGAGQVTVGIHESEARWCVQDVTSGHKLPPALGLAVDIGTTTVAAQLVDLGDGSLLDTQTSYNLQIHRGADVITRIDYARTAERLEELRSLVLDTVNRLIAQMVADGSVAARDIRAAYLAGNTTMTHLLLGLPPRYIRESPYVPTVNAVPEFRASEIGLKIHPDAVVACAPGVGSYVGGDITSGLLCTELPRNHDDVFLFMDIGTNGEIVIGNADWMVACACSAGPAFEGAGIKCGMRAAGGAMERVTISDDGESLDYSVIGGGKPAGICGSGLISLLGELFRREIVDRSGRFFQPPGTGRIVQHDSRRAFLLATADESRSGGRAGHQRGRPGEPDSHQSCHLRRLLAGAGECRAHLGGHRARLHCRWLWPLHPHRRCDCHRHVARSAAGALLLYREFFSHWRLHGAVVAGASPPPGGNCRPHHLRRPQLQSAIYGQLCKSSISSTHRFGSVSHGGSNV